MDLSPWAGQTATALTVGPGNPNTPLGPYDAWVENITILSRDGTVHPLFTGGGASGTVWGTCGNTDLSLAVESTPVDAVEGTTYYLSDQVGTTQMELSSSGWPVWQGQFTPFGQELDTSPAVTNYKFTGKERDGESGLDNFEARMYASTMGRFMSPDYDDGWGPSPVPSADFSNPQSLNLYSYVQNNPVTKVDSDGHDVNVCSNDANGNQKCTLMSNDQYEAAQKANNGSLNVPSLNTVGMNGSANITDSSGNSVGSATYVPNSGADYYSPGGPQAYAQLSAANKLVTNTTIVAAGVYGAVGGAILGGELAASTAAARSNLIFRLADHGTGLKNLLRLGHNVPLAQIGEIKNAIATAVATGAITSKGGNVFEGVVNVAGTFIRFTGATTPSGTVISNVMGNALQK